MVLESYAYNGIHEDIQCLVQDKYSRCRWSPWLMQDRRPEQRLCGLRGAEARPKQLRPEATEQESTKRTSLNVKDNGSGEMVMI